MAKKLTKKQLERRRRLIAQRKRRQTEALNKQLMQQNGLTAPQPQLNSRELKALQKQWYKIAAKDGFEDIEDTRYSVDQAQLKRSASKGRAWYPERQFFFAMGRNFLTHFRFRSKTQKLAWSLYMEGETFENILATLRKKRAYKKSIYTLFYLIQETAARCFKWNKENEEGLLYGQEHFDPSDYGIKIDMGFWDSVPVSKSSNNY